MFKLWLLPCVSSVAQRSLVPEAHCPACFRCSPALTRLLQLIAVQQKSLLISQQLKPGVLQQGNVSNMQGDVSGGAGLKNTALETC